MPFSGGRSADRRTSCRCKIAVPEITPPDIQIRDLTELPDPTDAVNNIALRLDIGEALDPVDEVIDDQFADAGKVVGILFDAFAAGQEKIGQALTAATGIPEFAGSYNSAAETTRSIGDSAEGIIAAIPSMVASGAEILMTPSDWTVDGALDAVQLSLVVAGFVPIVGDAWDGVNGVISLARGDKVGAALSFAAMTPAVGSVATAGGKLARFGLKKADDVLAAGKWVKCKVTGTGSFVAGTKVWVSAQANDDDENENSFSNAYHSVVAVAEATTITKTAIEAVAVGSRVADENPQPGIRRRDKDRPRLAGTSAKGILCTGSDAKFQPISITYGHWYRSTRGLRLQKAAW